MSWTGSVRRLRWLAAAHVLVLAASRAGAQSPLTLAGALTLARERNPDLAAAREAVVAAVAQRRIAVQYPNPLLTATTTKIPTGGTPAGTILGNGFLDRSYDSTLGVSQLFEIGGKRKSRRASADEGSIQARARLQDAERLLLASVVRTYGAAVSARETARIGRSSADSFERSAKLAESRESAGDISRSERSQVEIAAGRSRADAASAEAASRGALRSLEALLGMPVGSISDLSDGFDRLLESGIDVEKTSDSTVLERRPDLIALVAAVRRAEADVLLQRATRVPDPTLIAQYERQPPDQRNTVGFGVAIPLPVFNRNAGGIAAAESALSGAKRELEAARLRVRAEFTATRALLRAAEARAREYSDGLLPKADEVRRSVEYAYAEGGASLLELLEAERNANDIRLATAAALADLVAARADFAIARMIPYPMEGARP
jgi:outer membrane protein, heavy metal efflux system